jgi:GntR family transcriptional regulator/MocR family aminotransferase
VTRSKPAASEGSIGGADFLQLSIVSAPPGEWSTWLATQLRAAIADGRLPIGSRLPASRVLAAELRVSRGVVTEAYQRLVEDGRVEGRGRGGTVVVAAPEVDPLLAGPAVGTATGSIASRAAGSAVGSAGTLGARSPSFALAATGWDSAASPLTAAGGGGFAAGTSLFAGVPGTEVFEALRAAPARVDLSPGVPDLAAFPRAAWLRAERAVLGSLSANELGYGDPRGAFALRQAVSRWLARNRGVRASAEEIVIVAGVSQALALLAQVLGVAAVAVEDPGSLGTRQHLRNWGVDTPPVPVDSSGLLVSAIAAPAVLVTPAHQFPTGVVMSGARRRELLDWAAAGGVIIEDDYDAEHRYDRPPVPALRSMRPEVCYAGSVSKLLAPALRIGWLLVPPRYLPAIVAAKRNADLGNGVLAQFVLAQLMESGALERQLRFLRTRHRRRRDAMISAIGTHLPGASVHGAAAGLHLTVTFAGSFSDVEVAGAVLERGVKVQPLSWHRQRPGSPGLVLGYAARATAEIEDGVSVVRSVLRDRQVDAAEGQARSRR